MSAAQPPATVRRPMSTTDVPRVMAIEAGAYSHPWSSGNFIDSIVAGYHAEVWHAAEAPELLLGYFVAMAGVGEMHLLNLTVAPAWQGRGLGSALLEAVVQRARDRAAAALWLEVRATNLRARALYARRGFVEAGVRRGYYPAVSGREDAIVMRCALSAVAAPMGQTHAVD